MSFFRSRLAVQLRFPCFFLFLALIFPGDAQAGVWQLCKLAFDRLVYPPEYQLPKREALELFVRQGDSSEKLSAYIQYLKRQVGARNSSKLHFRYHPSEYRFLWNLIAKQGNADALRTLSRETNLLDESSLVYLLGSIPGEASWSKLFPVLQSEGLFDNRKLSSVKSSMGAILAIADPKLRVAALNDLPFKYDFLSRFDKNLLIKRLGETSNTYEMVSLAKISRTSEDLRWIPALEKAYREFANAPTNNRGLSYVKNELASSMRALANRQSPFPKSKVATLRDLDATSLTVSDSGDLLFKDSKGRLVRHAGPNGLEYAFRSYEGSLEIPMNAESLASLISQGVLKMDRGERARLGVPFAVKLNAADLPEKFKGSSLARSIVQSLNREAANGDALWVDFSKHFYFRHPLTRVEDIDQIPDLGDSLKKAYRLAFEDFSSQGKKPTISDLAKKIRDKILSSKSPKFKTTPDSAPKSAVSRSDEEDLYRLIEQQQIAFRNQQHYDLSTSSSPGDQLENLCKSLPSQTSSSLDCSPTPDSHSSTSYDLSSSSYDNGSNYSGDGYSFSE